jgi:hypothetical protein
MKLSVLSSLVFVSLSALAQVDDITGQYVGVSDLDERCLVNIQHPDQVEIEVVAGSKRLGSTFSSEDLQGQLASGQPALSLQNTIGTSHGLEKTTAIITLDANKRVRSIRMTWIESTAADFGGQESIVCDLLNQ